MSIAHFRQYWDGLIANCKTFQFTNLHAACDRSGNIKNHIYKVTPMSVQTFYADQPVLHVFVERYVANEVNAHASYAEFLGEYGVLVGSYVDVCRSIAGCVRPEETASWNIQYGTDVPRV